MYTKNVKKTRGNCSFEQNLSLIFPHLILNVREACGYGFYGVPRGHGMIPVRGTVPSTTRGQGGAKDNASLQKEKTVRTGDGPNG